MITVLITGCSMHSNDLIVELRNNYDNEEIRVVGINASETALLRKGVDAGYVVPLITDPTYIDTVLDICLKEHVDVILPFITAELPIMAENKEMFEKHGVKVSVTSAESLAIAGNKIELAKRYHGLMPRQKNVNSMSDIDDFAREVGYPEKQICCKLPNRCGGVGFAVLDEVKGRDLTIYNKFGLNRYITLDMFKELAKNCNDTLILQEYEEGLDLSMCCLAENGQLIHALGFEASLMAFGSAMFASISENKNAYNVAKQVIEENGLDGNCCFDFIEKEDGSVKLLEVNPRLSATLPFIAHAGLNLPYLRVKQLLGYNVKNFHPAINRQLKMSKNYESEYFE